MLKFMYLVNMPELTPENFHGVYENTESHNEIVGVHSMDMAKELIRQYVDDGFTLFNLCSGFGPEDLAVLKEIAGEGVRMAAVSYTEEEEAKLGDDFSKYGVIVQMVGVEENVPVEVNGPGFESTTVFVKDMEGAKEAAAYLAAKPVTFIEVCSWFKADMVPQLIEAIEGKVPVGSAGY